MTGFDWGAAFEFIRPWLSTGFLAGILAIIAKLYVDNRGLRLKEQERAQDFQLEVSADGRTNLQFIIDNLVRDIEAQRAATARQQEAHDRCEGDLSKMRDRYREQGKKLDGVVRQFLHFQLNYAQGIPISKRTPLLAELRRQFDNLAAEDSSDTPPA